MAKYLDATGLTQLWTAAKDKFYSKGGGVISGQVRIKADLTGNLADWTTYQHSGPFEVGRSSNTMTVAIGVTDDNYGYIQTKGLNITSPGNLVLLPAGGELYFSSAKKAIFHEGNLNRLDTSFTCSSLQLNATANPETGIYFRNGYASSAKYNCSILAYDHSGGTADGLSINGYDGVSFCTGSNTRQERARITGDGKVGIGTTSPSYLLHVNGIIGANSFVKVNGTSSQFLKADGSVDSTVYFSTGNDGSGSGLDADLLDGNHGDYYTTCGLRNLIARNVYNSSVSGFRWTPGVILVSGTLNRITFSGGNNYSLDPYKSEGKFGYYSISFWYKVADYVSGSTVNVNINDISAGNFDVSENKSWTFWTGTASDSNSSRYGFVDFEGSYDATITLSDIVVVRGTNKSQTWFPAPEDLVNTYSDQTIGGTKTFSSYISGTITTSTRLRDSGNSGHYIYASYSKSTLSYDDMSYLVGWYSNNELRAVSKSTYALAGHSHDSYLTTSTDQTVSGAKTFNSGKWILKGNESDNITHKSDYIQLWKADDSARLPNSGSGSAITNSISFNWYDEEWRVGQIRNGSSDTKGFAIALMNSSDTHALDRFRIERDGDGYLAGNKILTEGNWSSYCAASSHSHPYLPLAGGGMDKGSKIITYASSTSAEYGGAIEVREYNSVMGTQTGWEYCPSITFHWQGKSVGRLGLRSDGKIAWANQPLIHSGNIGDQSVNYATTAGTANSVSWSNVSGKPDTYTPSSHSHSEYLAKNSSSSAIGGTGWGQYTFRQDVSEEKYYCSEEGCPIDIQHRTQFKVMRGSDTWSLTFGVKEGLGWIDCVATGIGYGDVYLNPAGQHVIVGNYNGGYNPFSRNSRDEKFIVFGAQYNSSTIEANSGFKKTGYDNTSVLLAGGGAKLEADLSVSNSASLGGVGPSGYLKNYESNYGSSISSTEDISQSLDAGAARVHISNVEYSAVFTMYNYVNKSIQIKGYDNGKLYYRTQSAGKSWRTIRDSSDTYIANGYGYINNTIISQVSNSDTVDNEHSYQFYHVKTEFGGRNYYKQRPDMCGGDSSITKDSSINGYIINATQSTHYTSRISNIGFDSWVGDWTVSFLAKAETDTTIHIDLCDYGSDANYNEGNNNIALTTSYVKHKFTILNVDRYNTPSSYNGFFDIEFQGPNKIWIKDIKIEKGRIATDWSLAPEDIAAGYAYGGSILMTNSDIDSIIV